MRPNWVGECARAVAREQDALRAQLEVLGAFDEEDPIEQRYARVDGRLQELRTTRQEADAAQRKLVRQVEEDEKLARQFEEMDAGHHATQDVGGGDGPPCAAGGQVGASGACTDCP